MSGLWLGEQKALWRQVRDRRQPAAILKAIGTADRCWLDWQKSRWRAQRCAVGADNDVFTYLGSARQSAGAALEAGLGREERAVNTHTPFLSAHLHSQEHAMQINEGRVRRIEPHAERSDEGNLEPQQNDEDAKVRRLEKELADAENASEDDDSQVGSSGDESWSDDDSDGAERSHNDSDDDMRGDNMQGHGQHRTAIIPQHSPLTSPGMGQANQLEQLWKTGGAKIQLPHMGDMGDDGEDGDDDGGDGAPQRGKRPKEKR